MNDFMWSYLLHLGYNMWSDREGEAEYTKASAVLRCDTPFWDELAVFMAKSGVNTCVIDLGEGVRYESHPELAVEGSWSIEFLMKKLDALRALSITPVPKLNFSACHDEWMGEYARAVSTPRYYDFCADIIEEVCGIFDKPALFHIGMDEETYNHQKNYGYAVIRQGDLWWHDLYFLIEQAEKHGARAWMWSDYMWEHPELFLKKMPKSVLQSNWYYGRFSGRELDSPGVTAYQLLEENGFDQVPTGSNWSCSENFGRTVEHCSRIIAPGRLKGFLQTPWKPTLAEQKYRHFEAADLLLRSKQQYGKTQSKGNVLAD